MLKVQLKLVYVAVCLFAATLHVSAQDVGSGDNNKENQSGKLDLIFLLDASGSVSQENFNVVTNWVIQITSALDISDGLHRVGVIKYSFYDNKRPLNSQRFISTEIPLGAHRDQKEFAAAVSSIRTTNLLTFTAHALLKSINDFQASERFDDPTTAKVLIVVTEGKATDADSLESSAAQVRNAGIFTYAVGIGDADRTELEKITGGNNPNQVFHLNNFDNLSIIGNAMSSAMQSTRGTGRSFPLTTTPSIATSQQSNSSETGRSFPLTTTSSIATSQQSNSSEGTMSSFALTTTPSITTTSLITTISSTTTTQPRYSGKLDLIFLLDGSGSVGPRNFEAVKNWVIHLTNKFDISTGATRVGVIQYSHYYASRPLNKQPYIVTEIRLGAHKNHNSFKAAVSRITLIGYTTYTAQAMLKSMDDFRASDRFNDPSSRKALIVLTDGKASDTNLLVSSAAQVRDAGITTYAVGVGNADVRELVLTTARDDDSRVFYVSEFSNLSTIASRLSSALKTTEDA